MKLNLIFALTVMILLPLPSLLLPAHATGVLSFEWDEDKLPYALIMNITNDKISNDGKLATIKFGLYENKTGPPVSAVSYALTIRELESNQTLLKDVFHAENGTVILNLTRDEGGEGVTIKGASQDLFLNAWLAADNATEPITISSSQLSQDRTYNIHVEILGAYHIRMLLPPDQVPEADFVWNPASDTTDKVLIVPEFGTIVVFMIVAAMIGIVIAAGRFKIK